MFYCINRHIFLTILSFLLFEQSNSCKDLMTIAVYMIFFNLSWVNQVDKKTLTDRFIPS